MSTIDSDSIGTEITVDSFVDTMKLQLDAFKDAVVTKHKPRKMDLWQWCERFSNFIDFYEEDDDPAEDED